MSDWKDLDQLTPDQQAKARAGFLESELPFIHEYEFSEFGPKIKRRMKPELVKQNAVPKNAAPDLAPPIPTMAAADEDRIHRLSPAILLDSPTQPRSHYNEARLAELTGNVRKRGIIELPLVARRLPSGDLELVTGHRRKRAALAVGLETVPVILRDYTTEQVIEIQLLEIVQSEEVDPLDEAVALGRMLELKDGAGALKFTTHEAMAEVIGKSAQHIGNRLRLLACPREFQQAIHEGRVGESLGYIVAGVPDEKQRQKFAKEVLKGFGEGPMSSREALDHRRANYTVELRNPPFDLADAKLVPAQEKNGVRSFGGACTDCPFNSANMPEGGGKLPVCTLPSCFYLKQAANIQHVKDAALAAGGLVIEGQEAEKYIFPDGTPRTDTGMVNIDQAPTSAEVAGDKKAPKWRKMLEAKVAPVTLTNKTDGSQTTHDAEVRVKPTVVIDSKGRTHELVDRKLAIEAAKKNGFTEMFTAKTRRQSRAKNSTEAASKDAETKRKASDAAKKKLESAVAVAALGELVGLISKRGLNEDAWIGMLELAFFHSAQDAFDYVCQRRTIVVKDGDHKKALRRYADDLTAERMPGFVVELLLAGWVKASGVAAPGFVALADAYELDLKPIRAAVKADLATPKVRAKKPKPEPPPKPVRELIAELAKKHGVTSLAQLDKVSMKTVGKPYEAIFGGELNQLLDAIKALPIPAAKKAPKSSPREKVLADMKARWAAKKAAKKGGKGK